jgi:hypothetical protein
MRKVERATRRGQVTNLCKSIIAPIRERYELIGVGPNRSRDGTGNMASEMNSARSSDQDAAVERGPLLKPGLRPDPDRAGCRTTCGQRMSAAFDGMLGRRRANRLW